MGSYYLPVETSAPDLALEALEALLTKKLYDEVDPYDITRATTIKVGYQQAQPTGVNVLIFENDEDSPEQWPHRPMSFKTQRPTGGLVGSQASDIARLRVSSGRHLIAGGSMHTAAFTVKLTIMGRYLPKINDTVVTREQSRRVATIVEHRIRKSLHEAGPNIGSSTEISDSFGNRFSNGPFMGRSWTAQAEGESLNVLKIIQFWYAVQESWSTDDW
jgi:hypothetical protein